MQVFLNSTNEALHVLPWMGQDAAPWHPGYLRVGRTVPETRKGKKFEEFIVLGTNVAKAKH
jgi:hypothetical protein